MKYKKKMILIVCILSAIMILALAGSYALFTFNVTKNTNFKVTIGSLELSITDTTTEDKFIMRSTVPTKDDVALEQDGYTFTLTNTGTIDSYYTIYLDDVILKDEEVERLDNSYVKVNLLNQKTNQSDIRMLRDDTNERVLETGYLEAGDNITYTLRMWVDYHVGNDAQNKYFATQIRVTGQQSNEIIE